MPLTGRVVRDAIYWLLEGRALGFAVHPKLMAPLEQMARRHIEKQIADPCLRAKVTPDYTIGCKRILLSSDYYPALQRPNVELITEKITEITERAVVTADGTAHEADVIIYGTGFDVVESATALHVTGRDDRKLTPQTLAAYHGITLAGLPNYFMLLGPNTGLGHTSVVFMIETQIQHVMSCLRRLARDHADAIEVSEPAVRRYNTGLQRRLRRAVWNTGGCHSWYLDDDGIDAVRHRRVDALERVSETGAERPAMILDLLAEALVGGELVVSHRLALHVGDVIGNLVERRVPVDLVPGRREERVLLVRA